MSIIFPLMWVFLGAVTAGGVCSLRRDTGFFSFFMFSFLGMLAGWMGGRQSLKFLHPGYSILFAAAASLILSVLTLWLQKMLK